jgi:hypothetical protein
MQTRNGLTYGDSDTKVNTDQFCTTIHFLQKVEQKNETLDLAPPIHFLQKVEQKTEVLDLAPPFSKVESKVDFDEASTAWKLNKKSIGNGCYKYVCVKVKKNGHQCKNYSLKNCEHCKFHSTFRKG